MKTIRIIFLFVLILPGAYSPIFGQNLMSELEHIRTVLKNPEHFYAEIEITVDYGNGVKDENLPTKINTVIKIDRGNYFFQNEMVSMVINDTWVVGVMHAQKQIVYGRNNSKELAKARKLAVSKNLPIQQELIEKAVMVEKEGSITHYKMERPDETMKQVDLYINVDTQFFQKIIYQYADPSKSGVVKTVTTFKKVDTNATFEPSVFSEAQFLSFANEKVSPIGKYKGYDILYTDPQLLKDM